MYQMGLALLTQSYSSLMSADSPQSLLLYLQNITAQSEHDPSTLINLALSIDVNTTVLKAVTGKRERKTTHTNRSLEKE